MWRIAEQAMVVIGLPCAVITLGWAAYDAARFAGRRFRVGSRPGSELGRNDAATTAPPRGQDPRGGERR